MTQMLQKPVFALPGCQRMSVNTLLCDTLALADKLISRVSRRNCCATIPGALFSLTPIPVPRKWLKLIPGADLRDPSCRQGTSQARRRQLRASSGESSDATSKTYFPLHNTEARQHQGNLDVTSDVFLSCCCCPSAGAEQRTKIKNKNSSQIRSARICRARLHPEPRREVWWWNLRWNFGGTCFWLFFPAQEAQKSSSKLRRKFATSFAETFASFTLEVAGAEIWWLLLFPPLQNEGQNKGTRNSM